MSKEIIDVDYKEVKDATEATQATQTEQNGTETNTVQKEQTKITDRLLSFGKKIARPAAGAALIGTMAYIGYRVLKGNPAPVIPDSIRNKVSGSITLEGIDPMTDLNGEQQEQLNDIKTNLKEFVDEVNGETTE